MPEEIIPLPQRLDNLKTQQRFEWNENEMRKSLKNFAVRLKEIHDDKLYRLQFSTFENYCRERWGFSRQHGSSLIQAADARLALKDALESPELQKVAPHLTDRHFTELAKSPDPIATLKKIVVTNPKPTSKEIKLEIRPEKERARPPFCPTCKRPFTALPLSPAPE